MDAKKSPIRRTKRQAKLPEDNFWDCSVCTFRNTAEAFKCLMCDVRKGTSTRKPRINPQLAAQQVASQFVPATSNLKREKKEKRLAKKRRHPPRLKNVDRSSAQTREVTVNSVTVVITEYKPKIKSNETISSSSSSDHGSHSESSMDARWTSSIRKRGELCVHLHVMSLTLRTMTYDVIELAYVYQLTVIFSLTFFKSFRSSVFCFVLFSILFTPAFVLRRSLLIIFFACLQVGGGGDVEMQMDLTWWF